MYTTKTKTKAKVKTSETNLDNFYYNNTISSDNLYICSYIGKNKEIIALKSRYDENLFYDLINEKEIDCSKFDCYNHSSLYFGLIAKKSKDEKAISIFKKVSDPKYFLTSDDISEIKKFFISNPMKKSYLCK